MAKVYLHTENGFELIGEAGPMRIEFGAPDPLEAEVVYEDELDDDVVVPRETLTVDG